MRVHGVLFFFVQILFFHHLFPLFVKSNSLQQAHAETIRFRGESLSHTWKFNVFPAVAETEIRQIGPTEVDFFFREDLGGALDAEVRAKGLSFEDFLPLTPADFEWRAYELEPGLSVEMLLTADAVSESPFRTIPTPGDIAGLEDFTMDTGRQEFSLLDASGNRITDTSLIFRTTNIFVRDGILSLRGLGRFNLGQPDSYSVVTEFSWQLAPDAETTPIPEPGTALLLASAIPFVLRRRSGDK